MQKLPTWLEINLDTMAKNIDAVRNVVGDGVNVLLTVKADAYGHGAVQVVEAMKDRVECFGVATVDEALELGRRGVAGKILILSPILEDEISVVVDNGFAVTVSSAEFATLISDAGAQKKRATEVHVEIDTGMGRTGVFPDDAKDLLAHIGSLPHVRLGGVFTHFPDSDGDVAFTKAQVERFRTLIDRLNQSGVTTPTLHSANSGAIPTVPESHMNMVRPGLIAYGHLPGKMASRKDISPVMTWKCHLVQLRWIPEGATVSYGRTFVATRRTCMGVLPVGYGHGYPFRLSGRGEVLVAGTRAPVLGRVTMDMTMVDLTDIEPAPKTGDEVVLMGGQGDTEITLTEVAEWAGTISYEILCSISKRVPRLYIRNGKVQTLKSLLGVMPD